MGAETNVLASVEFEVHGQVQGCYFTKYCKEMAEELGIGGWVKNTKKGTIVGRIQGTKESLDKMIDWLSTKGSPDCKIERCDLSNFDYVARLAFNNFSGTILSKTYQKIVSVSKGIRYKKIYQ